MYRQGNYLQRVVTSFQGECLSHHLWGSGGGIILHCSQREELLQEIKILPNPTPTHTTIKTWYKKIQLLLISILHLKREETKDGSSP